MGCAVRQSATLALLVLAAACADPREGEGPAPSPAGPASAGTGGAAPAGSVASPAAGAQGGNADSPSPGAQAGATSVDAAVPDTLDGGDATDAASDAGSGDEPAPIPEPVPSDCVTEVTPGIHELACDGTTHVLAVPERCTRVACGVIVDVHGGSMSADMEDKNTEMRALGMQHGYLVIQPNASPNPLLLDSRIFVADVDDARVLHILHNVIDVFHADRARIHMLGFSEGGFMSWRFLCAHADLLASIAPAAAAPGCTVLPITEEIGCELLGTAKPAQNIPILYMQGSSDMLMDPACVSTWLEGNVYPTLGLDTGEHIAGDATYERTRFLDPDGVPFELIEHHYSTDASYFGVAVGGHCYPGSTDLEITLPGQLMGFGCMDDCSFDWAEEAVRFFQEHPKR